MAGINDVSAFSQTTRSDFQTAPEAARALRVAGGASSLRRVRRRRHLRSWSSPEDLVTSTGSAMAVPSWPLDAGRLIPEQWSAGVLFEWGHRAIAGTVSILTLTLAVWVWMVERRRVGQVHGACGLRDGGGAGGARRSHRAVEPAPDIRGRARDDRAGVLLRDGRDSDVHQSAMGDDGAGGACRQPVAPR